MYYLATHAYSDVDGHVYGGRYQWGRDNAGNYAINPSTFALYSGDGVANHSVSLAAGATYNGDGQILTNPGTGVNLTNRADTVHVYRTTTPYDWRGGGAAQTPCVDDSQCNLLWGNGVAISTATNPDGILYNGNYYQKQVRTVNDPCPEGWRVPTQNDWELLCNYDCDPRTAASSFSTSTGVASTNSGFTWVQVRCYPLSGGCTMGALATNSQGGYAVYKTSEWEAAGDLTGVDLTSGSAPQPLLFLPAAGYRYFGSGSLGSVGSLGYYWSSSINGTYAYFLYFSSSLVDPNGNTTRANGFSVRCVSEP
jgi:uncharacterized protein (TIGR02145 family)